MFAERRNYQRYVLSLTAQKTEENGSATELQILEMSVGGCFLQWFAGAEIGDNFRLRIPLTNRNFLPVWCKVIYRFPNNGIGIKFINLTRFEQDLLAEMIFANLRKDNLTIQESRLLPNSLQEKS